MKKALSRALSQVASALHSDPVAPPTVNEVAEAQLIDARLALLDAQAHAERWAHTVAMLTERCERLTVGP